MIKDYKKYINKEDLSSFFSLYARQDWLVDKNEQLLSLIKICKTREQKKLIIDLLDNFHYLSSETLDTYLNLMADFIVNDSGCSIGCTQIASITDDDDADSSQKILDYIKTKLYTRDWGKVKMVNRYGSIMKNHRIGKSEVIFVDEFVGGGTTMLNRINKLKKDIRSPFILKICVLAGMDHGLKKIEQLGYEVFCPLRLKKGISERYSASDLDQAIKNMGKLESNLAQKIGDLPIEKYSFGYDKAEALYSLQGCHGNTPNSVFPIFWWPKQKNGKNRDKLLIRYERGLA